LRQAGIDNPRLEARLLLAHSHHTSQEDLLRDPAAPARMDRLAPLLDRRAAREPLALILGHREFWSLDFAVWRDTLVPRPESETLIEAAVAAFAGRPPPATILDLGTGTGCLLLAALSEFPGAFGIGVDRSAAAAALAAHNAAALGMSDRAAVICADWADALDGRFDLILSNPPYIATCDLAGLMPEVGRYEPLSALDGGSDGFAAYRHLLPEMLRLLNPRGTAVLELGAGQARKAAGLARNVGLASEARCDLAGTPRAIMLRRALP
jgi:release factor glutamine methyltransferase